MHTYLRLTFVPLSLKFSISSVIPKPLLVGYSGGRLHMLGFWFIFKYFISLNWIKNFERDSFDISLRGYISKGSQISKRRHYNHTTCASILVNLTSCLLICLFLSWVWPNCLFHSDPSRWSLTNVFFFSPERNMVKHTGDKACEILQSLTHR